MSLDHYRFQNIIPHYAKSEQVSDTVELFHQYITTPSVTPEDFIIHYIKILTGALTYYPTSKYDAHIQAITALCEACASWASSGDTPDLDAPIPLTSPVHPRRSTRVKNRIQ